MTIGRERNLLEEHYTSWLARLQMNCCRWSWPHQLPRAIGSPAYCSPALVSPRRAPFVRYALQRLIQPLSALPNCTVPLSLNPSSLYTPRQSLLYEGLFVYFDASSSKAKYNGPLEPTITIEGSLSDLDPTSQPACVISVKRMLNELPV